MLEHLAGNWGNYASVAGLVFSILAFIFSKRASSAAREARDAALKRSLGEDVNDATRMAADIVRFVNVQRGEMALLRTGDLLAQTSFCLARWEKQLPDTSKLNLRRAQSKLLSMSKVLSGEAIDRMAPRQRLALGKDCEMVRSIFNEEHGATTKAADLSE